MRNAPEIIEVDNTQLEDVLRRVEQTLDDKDATLIRAVFRSYVYVSDLVEDKNTSIRRLRQLFFGGRTEKTAAVVERQTDKPDATPPRGAAADTAIAAGEADSDTSNKADSDAVNEMDTAAACKGHGRNGADAYRGAARIDVAHASLTAGDACPACGQGTVYEKAPGVMVRITGQPPLTAQIYQLQKLRCHLCGQVFTAAAPAEAAERKYDATAGSMIGLLKYGSGLPFNRLEGLQGHLEIPLPASTQWDIVAAVAANLAPAFDELIRQAAQGDVLHNDDTTVKILELMGRGRQDALASAEEEATDADQRSGLFTSAACLLRAWWRCATVSAWPCSSAAAGMQARTLPRCSSTAPRSCRRRSRCAMRCRATCPASCKRLWPIAWPMLGGSLSTSTIVFPSSAATFSKRWP
jgi:transposase